MADTGKQNPLGVNVLGEFLVNRGLNINPIAASYMGTSNSNTNYIFGKLVEETILRLLTWSIHDAYNRGQPGNESGLTVNTATYDRLIDIRGLPGQEISGLGNSRPPTYDAKDDSGVWTALASKTLGVVAPANTGYPIEGNTDYGQSASWLPYNLLNPNHSITQWGYIRLHALQAHNEFNWNSDTPGISTSTTTTTTTTTQAATAQDNAESCPEYWYAKGIDDIVSFDESTLTFTDYRYSTGSTAPIGGPVDPESETRMGTIKAGDRLAINDYRSGNIVPFTVVSNSFTPNVYPAGRGEISGTFESLSDARAIFGPDVRISLDVRIGPICKVAGSTSQSQQSRLTGPEYKEFLGSYLSADAWLKSTNQAILAVHNSQDFLRGMFTSLNDLCSGDISGVNSAFQQFGQDLINLGRAIDLSTISSFGLPSTLLKNLVKNGAVTPELSLALLSSGFTEKRISDIIAGRVSLTSNQERQLYGTFGIIRGNASANERSNLSEVLSRLNVSRDVIKSNTNPNGIESLADLLDIRKLFNLSGSWQSMTVPVYSENLDQPAKTFYPIFNGSGGINPALENSEIKEAVGTLIVSGTPSVSEKALSNPGFYQDLPTGFDSYLLDAVPKEIGLAAGAFSYSMQQIKNIENCDIEEFAQVVRNLESINLGLETPGSLPLLNQADVPTNEIASCIADRILGQGSGPYNTYTLSDFFGSMSGLPYGWSKIFEDINNLTTRKLSNIYKELFLGVTWQPVVASVFQTNKWEKTQDWEAAEKIDNLDNPYHEIPDDQPAYDPEPYINPDQPETPLKEYQETIPTGDPNPEYDLLTLVDVVFNGDGTKTLTYEGDEAYGGEKTFSEQRYSTSGQPELNNAIYTIDMSLTGGGGFGRGNAPMPEIEYIVKEANTAGTCGGNVLSVPGSGISFTGIIGKDDTDARSLGGGTFGRISWTKTPGDPVTWVTDLIQENDGVQWTDKIGQDTLDNPDPPPPSEPRSSDWVEENMPLEAITIENPPVDVLPVLQNGNTSNDGENSPGFTWTRRGKCTETDPKSEEGWPNPMNSVVNSYIDQANKEISNIFSTGNQDDVSSLVDNWNQLGQGLTREQRSRYTALNAVDIPKDYFLNPYPDTQIVFVDSMPEFSSDTRPHMNAQTIEAISNTSTLGGQSMIGMARSQRNQSRLQAVGIPLDNNISDSLSNSEIRDIMVNGTLPGLEDGFPGPGGNIWAPPPWGENDDPANPGRPIILPPTFPIEPVDPVIDDDDGVIDPELDTRFTPRILIPSVANVSQAINQVIECNCDCWLE